MHRFLVCEQRIGLRERKFESEKETKDRGYGRETIKIRASKLSIQFPTYEPRLVGSLLHYFLSLSRLIVLSNCSKHHSQSGTSNNPQKKEETSKM